ncbi:uncharacterized protein L201_002635 [Kwoniella dendrophila CBS 6074]|uniref:ABC transporter n=1 Tax=Kwoniella dendrophila CBS 6074 TaxID=1295534 RepID=A0AAX4JS50_9TREE
MVLAAFLTPLHYATPLFLAIPLTFVLLPKSQKTQDELPGIRPITVKRIIPRKSIISTSILLLSILAFSDILILVSDLLTARYRHDNGNQDIPTYLQGSNLAGEVVFVLGQLLIWGITLSAVWWRDKWQGNSLVLLSLLALGLEIPNLVGLVIREIHTHGYDKIFAILSLIPSSARLLILPILFVTLLSPRISYEPADERTGLLADSLADGRMDPSSSSEYGTFDTDSQDQTKSTHDPPTPATAGQDGTTANNNTTTTTITNAAAEAKKIKITKKLGAKKEEKKELSFKEAWPKFKILIPKLWPSTSIKLQFFVAMTGVMIAIDRVLTPLAPISLGFLVRALTERNQIDIWKWLGIYLVLRLLNANGILGTIQQAFWIPVVQYTDKEMQMLCFNHLLDLSLAYHTKRNTGEVIRIIERGSAINELFRTILFNLIPTFADIVIGFSVFIWLFGPVMTGSVLLIMIPYMVFTFYSTKFRKSIRKQYIEKDITQRGIVSDVLNNWESVKYFTAEQREFERFKEAVADVQQVDYKWTMGFQAIYAIQSLMLTLGFAVGAIIISWNIMRGKGDAALFVIFIQYYSSFTSPLNQLSSLYRSISTDITDSEKMLNLLAEKTEIKDEPDAKDLIITDGVIEFDNVSFSYDGKVEALKNVSFKLDKGQSMALVGETGSGKSTILRLIYRFYDVTSGKILIDNQDISKVKQSSLRYAIGIVPQDSVLWNDTIGANIAYGKPNSTDEEIINAAIQGKMHQKIMNFDEGYETVVGERGVRLSGGEKQRVSLARMFLKSPAILVLDEATSALDTETEREIQKSLAALAKGRSSLSIAHRLSTIINSDKIVVMKNGEILESGGYKELVQKNGAFARMWKRQIYTEAELLGDEDVEKVADSLPTADDFRRAHSYTAKQKEKESNDDEDDDDDNNDDDAGQKDNSPLITEESSSTTIDAKAAETPALIDLNDPEENTSKGFTVDSPPPPIVDQPESVSFADAVKSPSNAQTTTVPAPRSEETTQEVDNEAEVKHEEITHTTEPTSAATGPSSILEIHDPMANAVTHDQEQPKGENASTEEPGPETSTTTASEPISETPSVPFPTAPSPKKESPTAPSTSLNSPRQSIERSITIASSPTKSFPTESPKAGSVPFPGSASSNTTSKPVNVKRWSTMSASPSVQSALSSQGDHSGSSSPTKYSETSQTPSSKNEDKSDKRRKRLSSIKGFVRRISDQGLTRSPSTGLAQGLKSPMSEEPPILVTNNNNTHDNSASATSQSVQHQGNNANGIGQQPRERRVSTHGTSEDMKKIKKKNKKHGKH